MDTGNFLAVVEIIILLGLIWIGIIGIEAGIKKHEKWECAKWVRMEMQYETHYWTDWQLEQCRNYIDFDNLKAYENL